MIEAAITGALFGAVVPSFLALNLLMSGMQKDEKIRLLESNIENTQTILGLKKKIEF